MSERERDNIEIINAYLDERIKYDEATKKLCFYTGLSSFLCEPFNLFEGGESGVGKTYNVRETLDRVVPKNRIVFLAGMSPKSLWHQKGTLMDADGKEINIHNDAPIKPFSKSWFQGKYKDKWTEEYEKAQEEYRKKHQEWELRLKNSYKLIDWSNKIIVFLEEPAVETMDVLRPFLSHDRSEIEYEFTDKSSSGTLIARKVKVRGYPAFIFCSAKSNYMKEITTRVFRVNPDRSQEKIKAGKKVITMKYYNIFKFNKPSENEKAVARIFNEIADSGFTGEVFIPFQDKLDECFSGVKIRDMRDYEHFAQLVQSITLANRKVRFEYENHKGFIATTKEIEEAMSIFDKILEITRAGIDEQWLGFYRDIMLSQIKIDEQMEKEQSEDFKKLTEHFEEKESESIVDKKERGWRTLKQLVELYNVTFPEKIATSSLRDGLQLLEKAEYAIVDTSEKAHKYRAVEKPKYSAVRSAYDNLKPILREECKKGLEGYLTDYQVFVRNKKITDIDELLNVVFPCS